MKRFFGIVLSVITLILFVFPSLAMASTSSRVIHVKVTKSNDRATISAWKSWYYAQDTLNWESQHFKTLDYGTAGYQYYNSVQPYLLYISEGLNSINKNLSSINGKSIGPSDWT